MELAEFADGKQVDIGFTQAAASSLRILGLLYQTVLDRQADIGGLNYWLGTHLDAKALTLGFTQTAEFSAVYSQMSDAAFVHALYQNSGLAADAVGGEQGWDAFLVNHTRAELIASWIGNDAVQGAQLGVNGVWLV